MFHGNTVRNIASDVNFDNSSDIELIELIANNTSSFNEALSELVKRHYTWIYRICLMRLGNPADAKDVSQDVLLRMQKYSHRFENRSSVRTWLYRIAQNQCNTYTAKLKQVNFECIDDFSNVLRDRHSERKHTTSELADQVSYVLSKLSDSNRTIIELRFFQDLSLDELSKHLNIKLSATKMRLYRALDQFKLIYAQET